MGRKKKLLRFSDTKKFTNVFEPEMGEFFDKQKGHVVKHELAGNWRNLVFKNHNPIVLELGCGKGEYSVGMGRKFPNKNFLGIDIKGARIWYGAKEALENNLLNVAFLRTRIDFITAFFNSGEVDEIWITFPDPQEKENRARKRLTSKLFVDRYREILKPEGLIHLKTDSAFLYNYTQEEIDEHGYNRIEATPDLYNEKLNDYNADTQEILGIKTYYEGVFTAKGHVITYTKFTF
jgi:tRNA (guanine-N7-)-methyltransferase